MSVQEPGALVLVAGSTGGVGQLVTAKLIERGYRVRALSRGNKGKEVFRADIGAKLEVVEADLRTPSGLPPTLMEGVQAVVCCTGTTAFPSKRWDDDNGPKATDLVATTNLIDLAAGHHKRNQQGGGFARFVYVTSAGVERQGQIPWFILNLFGVLKFKRESEIHLEKSGLPFTIFRPGRLTDGPYTSYDLNTLLKATAGNRKAVQLALTDRLALETSRVALAEAVVQSLSSKASGEVTLGKKIAMGSLEGAGPGTDEKEWHKLFAGAQP